MKITTTFKHLAVFLLALGITVGCAGPVEKEDDGQVQAAEQAIAAAKAANSEAKAMGAAWRDTDKLIKKAEEALAAGDTGKAIDLANQARRQAENAIAQKKAEEERLAAAMAMQASAAKADDYYTVVTGDSLWRISGSDDIYGNPYQWPLIYKANRDAIKDADLIFPGQTLTIKRDSSDADIDAAIQHAKTRGAWSLGVTEQSDMEYLAQ